MDSNMVEVYKILSKEIGGHRLSSVGVYGFSGWKLNYDPGVWYGPAEYDGVATWLFCFNTLRNAKQYSCSMWHPIEIWLCHAVNPQPIHYIPSYRDEYLPFWKMVHQHGLHRDFWEGIMADNVHNTPKGSDNLASLLGAPIGCMVTERLKLVRRIDCKRRGIR